MRRTTTLLIVTAAVLVSLGAPTGVAVADAPVTVGVDGPETAAPGERISLNVTTTAETPVYGVQFELALSTATTGKVEQGEFLSRDASSVVLVREFADSSVSYGETRTGTGTGVTGEGTLARVELTVPESTDDDQLGISFETVKVSDPDARTVEVATEGTTVDVISSDGGSAGDAGGGGSSAGGGESESNDNDGDDPETATRTSQPETAQTGTAEWPAVVPSSVADRFDDTSRVRVVITLDDDASLSTFVDRLEANGGTGIRRYDQQNSVSVVVSEETLRSVSRFDGVRQVRYDSSGTVRATTAGTATSREDATATASSGVSTASPTSVGTTSTTFGLFGQPVIPLVVAVLCGVLWWRRTNR